MLMGPIQFFFILNIIYFGPAHFLSCCQDYTSHSLSNCSKLCSSGSSLSACIMYLFPCKCTISHLASPLTVATCVVPAPPSIPLTHGKHTFFPVAGFPHPVLHLIFLLGKNKNKKKSLWWHFRMKSATIFWDTDNRDREKVCHPGTVFLPSFIFWFLTKLTGSPILLPLCTYTETAKNY